MFQQLMEISDFWGILFLTSGCALLVGSHKPLQCFSFLNRPASNSDSVSMKLQSIDRRILIEFPFLQTTSCYGIIISANIF